MHKRMLFGIISIALEALIALIGIPTVMRETNSTVKIVRVKYNVEKGTLITAEQIESVEVSSLGLPTNVVADTNKIIGKYALVDLVVGDYILPTKISDSLPDSDSILSKLPGNKVALSMSVPSLAGSLSNKVRADDIVASYTYENGAVVKPDELQYVRVIAVTNSDGTNVEDAIADESRMAATVTFLVSEAQAAKMVEIENLSRMHLALVSRGDSKRADELLVEQERILSEVADDE